MKTSLPSRREHAQPDADRACGGRRARARRLDDRSRCRL